MKKSTKAMTGLVVMTGTWSLLGGFTSPNAQNQQLETQKQIIKQEQAKSEETVNYKKRLQQELLDRRIKDREKRANQVSLASKIDVNYQSTLKATAQSHIVNEKKDVKTPVEETVEETATSEVQTDQATTSPETTDNSTIATDNTADTTDQSQASSTSPEVTSPEVNQTTETAQTQPATAPESSQETPAVDNTTDNNVSDNNADKQTEAPKEDNKDNNQAKDDNILSNTVTDSVDEGQKDIFVKPPKPETEDTVGIQTDDSFEANIMWGGTWLVKGAPAPDTTLPSYKNNPYPYGQCTWYVYARAAQLGISFSSTMGNGQDWMTHLEYDVTRTPTLHSAVSFAAGQIGADKTYGHVAFVEAIGEDGSVLISESNVTGLGKVSYRVLTPAQAKQVYYVIGKSIPGAQAAYNASNTDSGTTTYSSDVAQYAADQMAVRTGVSAEQWLGVIQRESSGNPEAVNKESGAYGLFQLLGHGEHPGMTVDQQIDMAVQVYQAQGPSAWVAWN